MLLLEVCKQFGQYVMSKKDSWNNAISLLETLLGPALPRSSVEFLFTCHALLSGLYMYYVIKPIQLFGHQDYTHLALVVVVLLSFSSWTGAAKLMHMHN